ncbi:MAG: hypothetical protein V7L14_20150 [Nostoc sp.]|uniref:hypothetical protein n=1 Tax=Nostoc sp. TaxID=1180 RepID=UPI002FF5AE94
MIVTVVRSRGNIRYFRSDIDIWILDWNKWRDEFLNAGYQVPELDVSERFGITVVNQETAERFLSAVSIFEISKNNLHTELLTRYPNAKSWWDVSDLFPTVFVDFDKNRVGTFYFEGPGIEKYVPDGWIGEFVDFANTYNEDVFPSSEKFGISDGFDILKILNERGSMLNGT